MRIALICGSFLPVVGGMEWKVHYLALAYRAMGHAVVVLCGLDRFRRGEAPQVDQPYPVVRFGVHMRGADALGINSALGYLALRQAHRTAALDVVQAHCITYPGNSAVAFQERYGVPAVLTPTGGDVQSVPGVAYGMRLQRGWDRTLRSNVRKAAAVTAINFDMVETLAQMGARNRPVYVPNGVLWEQFQGGPTDVLVRRCGLAPEAFIFLAVGRNVPVKGYPLLLEAFAALSRRRPRAVLAIVGRNVPGLRPDVQRLGLDGRVHLLDQMPMADLPAVFRSAHAFVSTSLMEGFPQVVAQAMAAGLPCILSDNPGHRAVASVGGAVVVENGGPAGIADEMERLMEDDDRRRSLSAAGREGSRAYDWGVVARRYVELFERVRGSSC